MRKQISLFFLIPGLLLLPVQQAPAAGKVKVVGKTVEQEELPAINWKLASTGFMKTFRYRNEEIESGEPGRFFPGAVAFALGRMDAGGHFLMLNCGASQNCNSRRDDLEDRVIFTSFLDSITTPKARKSQLYDARTWALTSLGEEYMAKLRKRHPDLLARLGRMTASALAPQ
ncbi:MAG: hypothetical protein PHV33_12780 [Elusimicrobiales bacterium]|nr:hypothetical protein [Elusimicrobiales bacterium]